MHLSKIIRYYYYNKQNLRKLDRKLSIQNSFISEFAPIITLTTVPMRIEYIKPTLISLLNQEVKPRRIEINLSRSLFKSQDIPDFLEDLNFIKVFWQDSDYGPATKLIETLNRHQGKNIPIIVVDDDMYYPSMLVKDLITAYRADNDSVFCINGFRVPVDLNSKSIESDKAIKTGIKKVAIIEGCGGYILNSNLLKHENLLNLKNAPQRALFDDDIWISGHLSRCNIPKYQIPSSRRKSLVNTEQTAISGNRQELQTQVLKHFIKDWKLDEFDSSHS